MKNIISLLLLVLTDILIIFMYKYIHKSKRETQLIKAFSLTISLMIFWCTVLIAQILFSTSLHIEPIYFDYLVYISICFIPLCILFISMIFSNTKIVFKKWYLLLFVVPVISLIILWTNNHHHLFYKVYSTDMSESVFGPYMNIHSAYSYIIIFIGIVNLIKSSIKYSGFFSVQSLLFTIGTLCPIVPNFLGTLGVLPMNIYLTPIFFALAIMLFALAIFKFQFLSLSPIAIRSVVDRMSDAYIVINEENKIVDFNKAFQNMHLIKNSDFRNKDIFDLITKNKSLNIDLSKLSKAISNSKTSTKTFIFEKHFELIDKYFNIEISGIFSQNTFLGSLILFKDVTQHMNDLATIENKQDMLIERERLASLGQMIGGIAHNLKTPIMSIAGATEGISDLIKEYELSIGDPEVTFEDHHQIAKEMFDWISKIKTHTSYMSDVITTVKGQAVALSDEMVEKFTIEELIKRVNILMKHELKNALVDLNFSIQVPSNFELNGNINSLIQVINNMISNSIQAYNGEPNKSIDLIIKKENGNMIISIKDYGPGLPEQVKKKLFKEMTTTKGKNGTGLGLFMSYSNIRAHFNGNITYESEKDKGTQFNIILPI